MKLFKVLFILILTKNLYANEGTIFYQLGFDTSGSSNNSISFSYGFFKTFKSNYLYKISFFYEKSKINNQDSLSYGSDVTFGYKYKALSFYPIASVIKQDLDSISAYGYGYGFGLSVDITSNLQLAYELKNYEMTNKYEDYDYEINSISYIYRF